MPPKNADSPPTAVRRRPSLEFSLTGLVYCLMMIFMGLAAINSGANLLFGVFGLMIGILLISGVISRNVIRRLDVRRVLPDHGVVGRPLTVTYQFTNRKRFWPSLSVTVAELDGVDGFTQQPQAYMLHAAPGMTASVPTEVVPRRRGLHELGEYQVSTSFPFGFLKRALTGRQRDGLLAYPPVAQVDGRLLRRCRAAEHSGAAMRPRQGGQDEFYGVKDFRPGDNPRRIYWKRSARTAAHGALVAREMTQVAPPRLMLLVDTYAPDRSPARLAEVERAIAMAASLASSALDADLSVGLVAWAGTEPGAATGGGGGNHNGNGNGRDGFVAIEPSRGKRHRNDLLGVLARLPRNTTHDARALAARAGRLLRAGATAVVLTPGGDGPPPAGPAERGGGARLVLSAAAAAASVDGGGFRFEPGVDFAACVPADQAAAADAPPRRRVPWVYVNAQFVVAVLLALAFLMSVAVVIWLLRQGPRSNAPVIPPAPTPARPDDG